MNPVEKMARRVAATAFVAGREWLGVEDVRALCPTCARKMETRGIRRVKASVVLEAVFGRKREGMWENVPQG